MPRQELKNRLRQVARMEADHGLDDEERCALQVEKWVLICDLLALAPFATRSSISRSMQWREAARRLRDSIPPGELIEWALLQADIAHNHERGVRDPRPQLAGPCHKLLLDHAGMRRDQVRAALGSARAARESGADAARSVETS
jgi:hypothetical protein